MRSGRAVGTALQARLIDARMRDAYGIEGVRLMDAAGTAAALRIRDLHPDPVPVHVLAGPGHNGGDGWVIARVLSQCGYPTTVHTRADIHPWQKEAVLALGDGLRIESDFTGAPPESVLVDALFGIGLNRPVDDLHADWIRRANASGAAVWAVDIPSGLDATDGTVGEVAIRAHHTLAMGLHKSGYWAGDGMFHSGRIHLIPIGFAAAELASTDTTVFFLEDPPRVRIRGGAHKYQRGTVHVVGGSAGMTGAAVMAARAAWETGVGAVTVHVPAGCLTAVESHLVEPTKVGYGASTDLRFTEAHAADVVRRIAERPGTVVIGPGLGTHPDTAAFIRTCVSAMDMPIVADADALAALPDRLPATAILTPHPGELSRVTGAETGRWSARLEAARTWSARTGATVVSKGQPTAVITPDGKARIGGYDTRRYARMGSGDLLAGRIGAFLTEDRSPDAVIAALTGSAEDGA